tara:strand:- start:582 stop:725 length:144 start_codon:yes stop_codon:yes gene_type:complete
MTKKGKIENDKKIARTIVGSNIIVHHSVIDENGLQVSLKQLIPLNKR